MNSLTIMTKETPNKSLAFIENFEEQSEKFLNQGPDWLKEIRRSTLSQLERMTLPTTKDEEWKYTSVQPIGQARFGFPQAERFTETGALNDYSAPDEVRIVFINGVYSPELSPGVAGVSGSRLPQGVIVRDLRSLLLQAASHKDISDGALLVQQSFKSSLPASNIFGALNQALAHDGAFIQVKAKTVCPRFIHIIHVTSAREPVVISPRTVIHCETLSEVHVMESHISFQDQAPYLAIPVTDIVLNENSVLHYCQAQREGLKSFHIAHTRIRQKRDSQFNGFSFLAGARLTRNDLDVTLEGEGASATLNGLYSVYGEQFVDNHTCVEHAQPNGTSNQFYKGILNEASRAVFNGKIIVRPVAQGTNSYQLNKNLLLGRDAQVNTKPQLEIFADDVKCTHGATIGQLNEDEVFYLQSRSIPKPKALTMLSWGFADDILSRIPQDAIRDKCHSLLQPSFDILARG